MQEEDKTLQQGEADGTLPEEDKPEVPKEDKPEVSDEGKSDETAPEEGEKRTEAEVFSERVRKFLADYPAARLLKEEILRELRADPAIEQSPYCLEIALGRAAGRAYRSAREIAADEEFIREYVLSNEDIKGRIISEYLSQVAGGMPPAVIAAGGKMTALPPERPTSVAAAGKILERMLKERRI